MIIDFVKNEETGEVTKKTASDKNHRPCLPLKPQEKILNFLIIN